MAEPLRASPTIAGPLTLSAFEGAAEPLTLALTASLATAEAKMRSASKALAEPPNSR